MEVNPRGVVEAAINQADPRDLEQINRLLLGAALVESTLVAPEEGPSLPLSFITLIEGYGVEDDKHACGVGVLSARDTVLVKVMGLPKRSRSKGIVGTPAANTRQVTLVSRQEANKVVQIMGLGDEMPPGVQVENLIISGFPGLSQLPAGSLITFFAPNGERRTASLLVTGENEPCGQPHANLVAHFNTSARVPYAKAVRGRRGLTANVKTGGPVQSEGGRVYPGDIAAFWLPH